MRVNVPGCANTYIYKNHHMYRVDENEEADMPYDEARHMAANPDTKSVFLEQIPYNPESKNKLIFETANASSNGFGYSGQEILLALDALKGIDVYSTQETIDQDGHHEVLEIGKKEIGTPDCVTIVYNVPTIERNHSASEITGLFTMFETTKLSIQQVYNINTYDFCIVCGKYLVDVFKQSGVIIPIYYAPLGVRDDIFTFERRVPKDRFVFGHWGTLTLRKGTDLVVQAFEKAFPPREYPEVYLNIKATFPGKTAPMLWWNQPPFNADTRIVNEWYPLLKKDLVAKLHDWDCFVSPTRGEGFSLPTIEAMATGLPVIVTGWSSMPDFVEHTKTGLLLKYKMVPVTWYSPNDNPFLGEGAEPDFDDLVFWMKWVYENREQAYNIGEAGYRYVAENFKWERTAKAIIKAKDDYIKNYYNKRGDKSGGKNQ